MKCPKCGYLGFESVDRCRNCGYDFPLTPDPSLPDLEIRAQPPASESLADLPLIDGAAAGASRERPAGRGARPGDFPLFTEGTDSGHDLRMSSHPRSDAPLITRASPPRQPLAVRRATPEVPRMRTSQPRTAMLDLGPMDGGDSLRPPLTPSSHVRYAPWAADEPTPDRRAPAPVFARLAAAAIDILILAAIDVAVIYFTLQICGLTRAEFGILPKAPLIAFLVLQNGGYFVAFTAGGQTLGKMVVGIKVVAAGADGPLDLGHSMLRTAVWLLLAVPAGLGFTTALFNHDRRGLHDHCAGTRVVRAAAL